MTAFAVLYRTGKPAAHSVAESSQADGGEHVYSTLEPPCGMHTE